MIGFSFTGEGKCGNGKQVKINNGVEQKGRAWFTAKRILVLCFFFNLDICWIDAQRVWYLCNLMLHKCSHLKLFLFALLLLVEILIKKDYSKQVLISVIYELLLHKRLQMNCSVLFMRGRKKMTGNSWNRPTFICKRWKFKEKMFQLGKWRRGP